MAADTAPSPLLKAGEPVDWLFMFKLNSAAFPGCGGDAERVCLFGGTVQDYAHFGQQFVYASSADHTLQKGTGCAGDSVNDPLGATFDEIYNGSYHYVVWNDQFYDDPEIPGCTKSCGSPWGHSKGMLAWNDDGDGLVLQVTTPSWPAAGSAAHPRRNDGNTLGCVTDDNVLVSQHFFALKLTHDDVVKVLQALANASVVTHVSEAQIVNSGGPSDITALVATLGKKSKATTVIKATLSSGVVLISKPSNMNVPPWQLVSAELGSVALRTATWWANPQIYSTTASTRIVCWSSTLPKPGAVAIATSGSWDGTKFILTGGASGDHNHAKIGVSTSGDAHYAIFGDMNQQGTVSDPAKCKSSQNGRGGLFYVIDDETLSASVASLIAGSTAPTHPPKPKN
ncbi:MAG: deoxyribonuclease II family protein [Rhizomicrobium sp.]